MRNYNNEILNNEQRKYAYNFDYDVMHHYMIKAMTPFFHGDEALELGCYKGKFTTRLEKFFPKITCIEASSDAILEAKNIVRKNTEIIQNTFEQTTLDKKFETIIMTHVLEHLTDPVKILTKIRTQWLSDSGYFLLICPNANAPSRQLAVRMGLISHNYAVTEGEAKHGHTITYSFDTLERDVKKAGFEVVHKTGIFFKALANFQWDKLLKTDIISQEYLEACYELGQIYPELCASIFLVCKK